MNRVKIAVVALLCGFSIASHASCSDVLMGTWKIKSGIPTYYDFGKDCRFLVNFVNPQTKRVMAVSAGSYSVENNRLILNRDGAMEALEQSYEIKGDSMTWNTISSSTEYEDQVLLDREEIELYTPEVFYAEDNKNIYNTYLK